MAWRSNRNVALSYIPSSKLKTLTCKRHTYVVCREVDQNGNLKANHVALSTREGHGDINCTIWEAGRATSAAPTYFPSQRIERHTFVDGADQIEIKTFVDGGLGYNNPIATIQDELPHLGFHEDHEQHTYYLSIGTGKPSADKLQRARGYWRRRYFSVLPWLLVLLPPYYLIARYMMTDDDTMNTVLGLG